MTQPDISQKNLRVLCSSLLRRHLLKKTGNFPPRAPTSCTSATLPVNHDPNLSSCHPPTSNVPLSPLNITISPAFNPVSRMLPALILHLLGAGSTSSQIKTNLGCTLSNLYPWPRSPIQCMCQIRASPSASEPCAPFHPVYQVFINHDVPTCNS